MEELKPCPFCGNNDVDIQETTYWTGMRSVVLSVTLRHHCHPEGFHRQSITIREATKEEAIKAWNERKT